MGVQKWHPEPPLDSVAGSQIVTDTSGDTSIPFDRGVPQVMLIYWIAKALFLIVVGAKVPPVKPKVHWADFPQRLKRSEPTEHPHPRRWRPELTPAPFGK